MIVAVLSGKGGTGKTTVAVNLAASLGWRYVDCDVEEPNGWLFLRPRPLDSVVVTSPVPVIARPDCSGCGACADACQFQALAVVAGSVKLFSQLCHGCGLCSLVCPQQAIQEEQRVIGQIDRGQSDYGECWRGVLQVGEPSGVRIIDQMLQQLEGDAPTILDCAPGGGCSVVAAAQAADFALLVTEATPFGAHDLDLSLQLLRSLNLPGAIVVNRSDGDDALIHELAERQAVPVIASLPFSRQAAAACAVGQLLCRQEGFHARFQQLGQRLEEMTACS